MMQTCSERKKVISRIGILLGTMLIFCLTAFAQEAEVRGKVLDALTHQALEGVHVMLEGTNTVVATDAAGGFIITCRKGETLIFTFIGYETKNQVVSHGQQIEVLLPPVSRQLDDIVVTASGIKKEAKRLGYAVQTIDASVLTKARESNPVNSLKGNAAGLSVNINQEIGRSPDIVIRGENNSNDRPMFVVDGMPIGSDTYNINPDDIENITVLKGPNASALYGFQGKNGALIITTKKATAEKEGVVVSFNSSTQFYKGFIALPLYQDQYGAGDNGKYAFGGGGSSAESYRGNGATGKGINDYDYDVWGPQFRGQLLPQYDGKYDPSQTYTTTFADGKTYTGHVQPTPWTARGKDNLKNFIETGVIAANSIAITSSSKKTDMRFSVGNTYQKGIVPNTRLHNFNLTASLTQRFNSKLSFTGYLNYSRRSTPNLPDVNYGPNSIIYNIILWGGANWSMSDMRNYWQPGKEGTQQKFGEFYRYNNPYFMSHEWLRGHVQNNAYGYISLNYKFNQNLEFQFRPAMTAYDMFNSEKMPWSAGAYGRDLRKGDYREDRRSLFDSYVDAQLRYNKTGIGGLFDIRPMIGGTVRNFNFNSGFTSTNYLNVPGIYSFSNSIGPLSGSSFNSSMRVLSAYYSVDIGYKSYVTANIIGRVDYSSSLPSNSKAYFYPSINLATVLTDYLPKLPEVISFAKVRASYAQSKSGGTNAFFTPDVSTTPAGGYGYNWPSPYNGPGYQFAQNYSLTPVYTGQNSARYTSEAVSPSIQTADRKAYEFGIDLRFFQNRLGIDVTRYRYRNTGIVSRSISASSGYSSLLTNGDEYTNDGWEVVVNADPVKELKGIKWHTLFNLSTFVRRWVNNSNPDNYSKNGERIDLVYADAFIRTPDGQLVIDKKSGVLLRYSDAGSSAKKIYGHYDPDWQWGWVNTISYKDVSLRFQFDGMTGGIMEDIVRKKTLQGGRHIETVQGEFGKARPFDEANVAAYTGEGVNLTGAPIQLDPVHGNIVNMNELTVSPNTTKSRVQPFVAWMASVPDLNMVSKTFAKLREVTLSYNLPAQWLKKQSFFSQVSFSLVGRNLLYFFPQKYKDLDVDQYTQMKESTLQTPTTRSFGFNISAVF